MIVSPAPDAAVDARVPDPLAAFNDVRLYSAFTDVYLETRSGSL
jgi:hypothetical protein